MDDRSASDQLDVLRAALDVVDALVVAVDVEGRIVYFNAACQRTTAYGAAEVEGRLFWEVLLAKDEADRVRAIFPSPPAERYPNQHENDWITRDGERRTIAWTNTAVQGPQGEVRYVVGTGIDVTETRQVERDMRSSEADVRRLIQTANEGVWVIDTAGATTFANDRMAEMLACELHELLGKSMWDFMDEDWKATATANLDKRNQGVREQHDFLFRRADGGELWAIVNTNPIENDRGEVVGALGMVTDITDRKRSEARRQRLVDELDHRVKNTMASVLALVEESVASASSLEEVREALTGRLRSLAAAHDLLSQGRWEKTDLGRLLERTLEPFVGEHSDRVHIEGPRVVVEGPAVSSLALTLHELTTNAAKHGALSDPRGAISVAWKSMGPGLRITWRESGRPVAAPTSRGLGLELVEAFIEHSLGGEVEISFPGEGLICTMDLPGSAGRVVAGAADA